MSRSDDDELLTAVQSPRWIRWAAWSLAGVLVAVLVGGVAARHHHAPSDRARPAPVAVSSSVASVGVAANRNRHAAQPRNTAAVAEQGVMRWEVQGATLYVDTPAGPGHFVRAIDLPSAFRAPASAPDVSLDPVTGDAWVVLTHSRPSLMIHVSLNLARIVRQARWATPVSYAAAYAGHLYLSTRQGIADLAPHAAQPRPVPGLVGATGPLVADPSRHRVIAVSPGSDSTLWTFSPHTAPSNRRVRIPHEDVTMTVVTAGIWILGRVGRHAVLERLQPTTLQPTTRRRLPADISERAMLLPGSARALWVYEPADPARLVCADARSGAELQTWHVSDANSVAALHGSATIALDARFQTIKFRGCHA